MFNQKSSSTLSTTLLALILGASVFMAGQVWAAEMVKDPSTGKMIKAPQYGGQIVFASTADEPPHTDTWFSLLSYYAINLVLEKAGHSRLVLSQGQMGLFRLEYSSRGC